MKEMVYEDYVILMRKCELAVQKELATTQFISFPLQVQRSAISLLLSIFPCLAFLGEYIPNILSSGSQSLTSP